MDGRTLRYQLAYAIGESTSSAFLDDKTTFDYLYEAAIELARCTQALNGSQSITTVAETAGYLLNPDFLALRIKNDSNEWVIKYNDGTSEYFIPFRSYEAAYYSNNTDETSVPSTFAISDYQTQASNVTGTASATSTVTNDEATLTSSTATFTTSVAVGDAIHNTTDGSHGVVLAKTSSTVLQTALFYGTNNYWTSTNAYIIIPQGRRQLVVDPASLTSGHTITVPYTQKPDPVYSDYRTYRFDRSFQAALVKYAAWLYKYRDSEPNYGDAFFKYFIAQVGRAAKDTNTAYDRTRFRVNLRHRSLGDRSYR